MLSLKDTDGKPSSKRIAGYVIGVVGLIMGCVLFGISIGQVIKDPATAINVFKTFMYISGMLLGVSVVEKLGGKK